MKACIVLLVLCVFSRNIITALDSEESEVVRELCWSHAETLTMTSSSVQECIGAGPPKDTELEALDPYDCLAIIKTACELHFKMKDECSGGMKLASAKRCGVPKSDMGKTCCEECSLGRLTGESQGKDGCGGPADEFISPTMALRKNAYYACCVEAAEKPETTTEKVETTTSTSTSTTSTTTTPSTTTERKVETTTEKKKEKCKPTSCEQVCDDDDGKITCSCRDGFRLKTDKKSCKDINECAEATDDLCTKEGTVCHNTPGSFKCVPIKKREVGLSCPPGFKRNVENQVCDDINECQLPRPPCPKYLCENTIGGYKCAGKPGKPVTEASAGGTTETATTPVAKNDICPPGFRSGPNDECIDIDECEEHLDDCQRLSQHCINTHGSYFCQDHVSKRCSPGFKVNEATGICEDINECDESTEVCRRNEVCVNLPGAYNCQSKISTLPKLTTKTCQEGTRLRPGGTVCEDIDECREGTHLCDQFQNCINTFGGHECRCKNGFELDSVTASCTDIDECALKLDNCGSGQYCLNVLGTFTCTRRPPTTTTTTIPPYEYEYYDEDIPVEERPKPPTTSSTTTRKPTTTSSTTTTSTTTPKPTTTTPKPTTSTLRPRPYRPRTPTWSPYGTRRTTTERSTSTTERMDFTPTKPDELPPYIPRRPERTTTTKRPDPYSPRRPEEPTPYTSRRPERTTTTESPNIYGPRRPNEVTPYIPRRPERTNTTEIPDPYAPLRPNEPTPYIPRRPEEPTRPDHRRPNERRPVSPTIVTVPTPIDPVTIEREKDPDGGYDINTDDIPKDRWTNVIGKDRPEDNWFNRNERCLNGFERGSDGMCIDVDECETGRHICTNLEVCVNRPGGYLCDCMSGFRRDVTGWCIVAATTPRVTTWTTPRTTTARTTTSTTTERTTSTTAVSTPEWPYRNNGQGRPYIPPILCELGYTFDRRLGRCVDVDECVSNKDMCAPNEDCVNIEGGYRCVCGRRCRTDSTHYTPSYVLPPESEDTNVITVGSQYGQRGPRYIRPTYVRQPDGVAFRTSCPWGYTLTQEKRCMDIDECASSVHKCGPQQQCENFYGGYACQCPAGHRLVGQDGCADIDECKQARNPCISECVNTVGSFRCACGEGFRNPPSNEQLCVDIDECAESPDVCEQECSNVWGGYRCYCRRGYRLQNDNRTCVDVDECAEWSAGRHRGKLCGGECVNVPGSYRCSCPSGYRLSEDGRSCIDIDECESGEASCAHSRDPGMVCQNTRGSYHCHQIKCPSGYKLDSRHRCTRIQRQCLVTDQACLRQPSTYSYNFITFTAHIYMPSGSVDLFTMHGPDWSSSVVNFEIRMVEVHASPHVVPAELSCFDMRPMGNVCVISLLCSLDGPQVAELELTMSLHTRGQFAGSAVARLIIIVSQYDY